MAESFGADTERYDRTRPSYPSALVDRIVETSPGRDVLDVGTGTGISARLFAAAGCRVLGVDVDERMAAFARGIGLDVEVAKFEEWESAGRTFDAVVAGQTWHWIEPVAGTAKAAAVLRPAGRLAVFWNAVRLPSDLGVAIGEVYRRVLPEFPFFRGTAAVGVDAYAPFFERATEGMAAVEDFGEIERWRSDWERTYTKDEWLDQVPTGGGHAHIPPDTLADLLAGIGRAIDDCGGTFIADYATVTVTATTSSRTPPAILSR
jgi:SAM-dependent methyltransferase